MPLQWCYIRYIFCTYLELRKVLLFKGEKILSYIDLKISFFTWENHGIIWNKVFNSGLSKFCERQPLQNFSGYGLLRSNKIHWNFLKAVFHEIYLVHSWILCPIFRYLLPTKISFPKNLIILSEMTLSQYSKGIWRHLAEVVAQTRSVKKVFLEFLQNSQANNCARVSFWLKLQAEHLFYRAPPGDCFWPDNVTIL